MSSPCLLLPVSFSLSPSLLDRYGKQVTPAFSKNPVLKQIERLKKMTDAEEQAERKKEMAASLAAKVRKTQLIR